MKNKLFVFGFIAALISVNAFAEEAAAPTEADSAKKEEIASADEAAVQKVDEKEKKDKGCGCKR